MNSIDSIGLGIIGFSLFIGFIQGFTREVLRVVTWSGALGAAYYGHGFLEPFLTPFVTKGIFLKAVSMGFTFLGTLIILNMISHSVSYSIRSSFLKGIDSSLGMLLGGLRGGILLTVAYALFLSFNLSGHAFKEIQQSKLIYWIEHSVLDLCLLCPENTALKNFKYLINKRQKESEGAHSGHTSKEVVPVVSASGHPIAGKNHNMPPSMVPPMVGRPLLNYVKELFHFPFFDDPEKVEPLIAPTPDSSYTPHQRDHLNQLVSTQGKKS